MSRPATAWARGTGERTDYDGPGCTDDICAPGAEPPPPPPPPATVAVVLVSLGLAALASAGATTHATAVPRDSLGVLLPGLVVAWSSANPAIVSVSSAGLVTAVGPGTTSVIAVVDGVTGSAPVSVGVIEPPPPPEEDVIGEQYESDGYYPTQYYGWVF